MSGKYWNIGDILPYQRIFNFVNGPRSIGKTYTTQKWLIKEGLKKQKQTLYIMRTEHHLKMGGVSRAFSKVLANEYPEFEFDIKADAVYYDGFPIVMGASLSQVQKLKSFSYPDVYYMLFDEYQIEKGSADYLNGYNEPELFVNLYHTVDREEQRVKCFLLGNNTSFYNPYHTYPLFGIPSNPDIIRQAGIWKNELCLFQMAEVSEELQAEKDKNPFLRRLAGTRYGEYANQGIYRDDSYENLGKLGPNARYMVTLVVEGKEFGLYNNQDYAELTVSDAVDQTCPHKYAILKKEKTSSLPYLKTDFPFARDILKRYYKMSAVTYTDMGVKSCVEPVLLTAI